jgi:hypothetical protein
MKKDIEIKLISTISEFNSLEYEWREFERTINNPNLTSSFDWLNSWWNIFKDVNNETVGFNKKLLIVCLYELDKLVAIAPFLKVYRKKYGLKVSFIEFLGQQWAGNYLDIISIKGYPLLRDEIFDWLYNNVKFDAIFLKYIPEYTSNFNKKTLYLYSACPQIEVNEYPNHIEFIKNKYSKNLKQNLRTALNRAKKSGFDIETSVEQVNERNLMDIIQISEFKLSDGKSSIYKDNNKLLFMKEIVKKMTSNVVFVSLNNKKVSYRTNVFFNNNKFCIDASYDRSFRKFELGSISVDANLKDSFTNKIFNHCFGPGLDFYKKKFTKKNINIYMFINKGNTIYSFFILILIKYFARRKAILFNKELFK